MNGFPTWIIALVLALVLFVLGTLHRRDVGARRTIERLHRRNDELTREIASLELLKSRLLSRVGEALSIPLKRAGDSAERLTDQGADLPEGIRAGLADLTAEVSSITRILRVFEEMASRDGEDTVAAELPVVELDGLAAAAVQTAADQAAESGISLAVSLDPAIRVRGSGEHLSEAMDNLFKEALRRAAPGSMITAVLTSEDMAARLSINYESQGGSVTEPVLGTGMARLIVTSFGGWLNEDHDRGLLSMSLPLAEGGRQ